MKETPILQDLKVLHARATELKLKERFLVGALPAAGGFKEFKLGSNIY